MRAVSMVAILSLLVTSCGLADPGGGLECQRTPPDGRERREGQDPLAPGGPLAGRDVTGMTSAAVGAVAEDAGFEVTYRYSYEVGPQPEVGSTGYAECWCIPPPGRVYAVAYDSLGRVIVMAEGEARDAVRPQPDLGWGCEDAVS